MQRTKTGPEKAKARTLRKAQKTSDCRVKGYKFVSQWRLVPVLDAVDIAKKRRRFMSCGCTQPPNPRLIRQKVLVVDKVQKSVKRSPSDCTLWYIFTQIKHQRRKTRKHKVSCWQKIQKAKLKKNIFWKVSGFLGENNLDWWEKIWDLQPVALALRLEKIISTIPTVEHREGSV